jgi:hypothetical protein
LGLNAALKRRSSTFQLAPYKAAALASFRFGGGRVHEFEDEALAEGVGGAGDGGEGDGGVFGIEQAVELGADFGGKAGSSSFRLTASSVGMTRVKRWVRSSGAN